MVELIAWRLGPHRLTVKQVTIGIGLLRKKNCTQIPRRSAATWCAPHVHCWQLWLDDEQLGSNAVNPEG